MTEEKTAEIVENTEKNGSACLKSRGDLARELFKEGYNCSQAVTLAFADELEARGISREIFQLLERQRKAGLGYEKKLRRFIHGTGIRDGDHIL